MERVVVVDAGAVIHGAKFDGLKGRAVTTTGVYREIKDRQAKQRLETLPFEITTREPTSADVKFVKSFAKETGDLGFLSANDIEIIALTYMMQRETGEIDHLRNRPDIPKVDEARVAFNWGPVKEGYRTFHDRSAQKVEEEHPEAEDGWEVVKTKKTNKRAPKPRVVPTEAEDNPAQEEVAAPVEIPAVVQEEEVQPEEEAQSEDIDASEPQIISETAENAEEECLLQECADEFPEFSDESDWSEDGSDAGDWITPENLHRMDVAVGHEDDVKVACITGDYSAQNVLLQIGLSVMTFDGYAVKNVKIWGLVCRACCHFTRDSTKQFCAKCGHAMMMRVPITVDGEGRVTLHHHKRKANLKGTIYAIPKNRGGREANNLILAEDQMMMGGRDRMLRQKQKLYEKERQMRSLDSDTCLITKGWDFRQTTKNGNHVIQYGAPKVQIGYGRKNPNANNFRKKNK